MGRVAWDISKVESEHFYQWLPFIVICNYKSNSLDFDWIFLTPSFFSHATTNCTEIVHKHNSQCLLNTKLSIFIKIINRLQNVELG